MTSLNAERSSRRSGERSISLVLAAALAVAIALVAAIPLVAAF